MDGVQECLTPSFQSGPPRLLSTHPADSSSPSNSRSTFLVLSWPIGSNSEYTHSTSMVNKQLTAFSVAAVSIKEELGSSPGDSPLLSRSPHSLASSPYAGSFLNHLVGSSRLVERKKPVTSSEDFVVNLVRMLAKLRPSFKISATSLSSNARPPSPNHTFPCFSVSALASFTLAVVFNSSSGCRSCKSGSVLPV